MLRSVLCAVLLVYPLAASAQTSTSLDAKVQPPELVAPSRGSLAGQLAGVTFDPGDLARGVVQVPSPFEAPQERGPLLAQVFPRYSAESGLTEWGIGWQGTLAITRYRVTGDLDFTSDELSGPWGRMAQGADGAWYPVGISEAVRVVWDADTLVAYLPDGTRMTFGGAWRIATSRGTYAWFLSEVRTPQDRRTVLEYGTNPSGKLRLVRVDYGGIGADFQHRLELDYEALQKTFTDYRAGQPVVLDQRVSCIRALTKNTVSGALEERWRYTLSYTTDGLGPGFYLAKVQQTFGSGESPPPVQYTYRLAGDHLAEATLERSPKVDAIISALGSDALQPNKASLLDADRDGLQDLEHSYDYTLIHQGESGFTFEALPPAPSDVYIYCRRQPSSSNVPRTLARLRASDDEHYVVDLRTNAYGTSTALSVCNRVGQRIASQSLTGNWALSSTVRLVDVNRDQQPEVVRVQAGMYRVLPNVSTPGTFAFGAVREGTLSPSFTPDTAWVHDFNGDGIADLIARSTNSIVVWYGKGNFEFASSGQSMTLWSGGVQVTSLGSYALSFVDANKDGLTDIVLTQTSTNLTALLVNRGDRFVDLVVPALRSVDNVTSRPVVADFSGSGNTELGYTRYGQGHAVALDGPDVGLMTSADDGRGTVLRFGYARARSSVGAGARNPVLASVTVESSGYDTHTQTFDYADPRVHSVGKFLVGFDHVTRTGPREVYEASFLNGDTFAGLLSSSTRHDLNSPGVHAYTYRTYADTQFRGLPWKRLAEEGSGFTQEDGQAVGERTEYQAYTADVCPSRMVRHTASGTLTLESERSQVGALSEHLHCLVASTRVTGTHADPSLDFSNEVRLTRDALGLPTKVEDVSPAGEVLTLQEVVYRADSLIDSITVPGKGTTRFEWAPGTLQLTRVTGPDGVVVEVTATDPLTGKLLGLTTRRGAQSFTGSFAYDGQERLQKQWNDLGGASELNPNVLLAYRYASAGHPGSILSTVLVDAAQSSSRTEVEWQTAAGEVVARGSHIPEGWTVQGLNTRNVSLLEQRTYARSPLGTGVDVTGVDYATLLASADVVGVLSSSGLGLDSSALQQLHADVQRQVDTHVSVDTGWLKQESTENASFTTRRWLDAQKHLVAYDDEAGNRYSYGYDALGRLRSVTLPDGRRHTVSFDGNGRVSRVDREGVASVTYSYQPGTGLRSSKRFLGATGVPLREEAYTYDAVGRLTLVTHRDVASGETRTFRSYYDGATPAEPTRVDAPGLLTAVEGPGFVKLLQYRVDGKLTSRVLQLADWRTVESQLTYREDGTVRTSSVCVRTPAGETLSCTELANATDGYGRVDTQHLNGQLLSDLSYDGEGRVSGASLASGASVSLSYDSLTRALSGYRLITPTFTSGTSWRFNARGLLGAETLEAGALSLSRSHTYTAQRFLSASADAQASYAYSYDASGLPSRIEENGVARTLSQSGSTLTAGNVSYTLDELGRTVQRGDLTLSYGPDGQLARATRGSQSWDYVYDETGQRLLKLQGGSPVAAYLEGGGYLDASGLTLPMKLAGKLVGVIQDNAYRPLATDTRGSVLSDYDGTARIPSPYGTRTTRPASSAALDYVEKGYDADLGFVRMGVRDYDPAINRFTTPDPLFLESPERCVRSGVECNLYSYAANDPVNHTDPTGTCLEDVCIGEGAAVVAFAAFTIAIYFETPAGQRSLQAALLAGADATGEAIEAAKRKVQEAFKTDPKPDPEPKPRGPGPDPFPWPDEGPEEQLQGHHTLAKGLMNVMVDHGAMSARLNERLQPYGRPELLYVSRPEHLLVHQALTAFLLDRYPELGTMRNGFQFERDWEKYVSNLEKRYGLSGQALQDRILEDHEDFYWTLPMTMPSSGDSPIWKFNMEREHFINDGPVK